MAIYNLDFLNKNQFRCFPLKAQATLRASDTRYISNTLIVACTITTTQNRTNIHISQIHVAGSRISLTVSAEESGKYVSLGYFIGNIEKNFTTLQFTQFKRFVGGSLTVGSQELLTSMSGGYFFEPDGLPLEESNIFYYTPPQVTGINRKGHALRGRVEFGSLFNLIKTKSSNSIALGVKNNNDLASLADHTSEFNNCKTPLIHFVNDAVPFYNSANPLHQGNLYLVGVKPVVFYGVMGEGNLETQTELLSGAPLTMDTLCTARNKVLPPIDPIYLVESPKNFVGKENFYTKSFTPPQNFSGNAEPEFLSWPQFFKNFSKILVNPIPGQTYSIVSIADNSDYYIRRVIYINSGNVDLTVTLQKNGVDVAEIAQTLVPANTAIVKNLISTMAINAGIYFDTYIDPAGATGSGNLQVSLFYR